MKYVIIGNGIASIGAIEGIRKVDTENTIMVIGAEDTPAYGRPLISYLLAGKITPDKLSLRPMQFYKQNNIELKLGTTVTTVDVKQKSITTSDGETIEYEHLLIGTGGAPFTPPIPGSDGEGVYNFTNIEHAQQLISCAKDMKRAVVIGGGLIGLKAGEALFDRGVDVSIVELSDRVLSMAFDSHAAELAAERLHEVGLNVLTGVSVKEIQRDVDGKIVGVHLTDGGFLQTEVVVIAIGVIPNFDLAKDGGIIVDKGIVVNDHMATSEPNVYAAGDVAQALDLLAGENRVLPIWPNAYNQGYCAGKNMAGESVEYSGGLSMNSISFYGLPTISVGTVNPSADEQGVEISTILDKKKKSYRKLVFKDNTLIGYVLVGDIDKAGLFTAFVKFKLPIDDVTKGRLMSGDPDILLWPDAFFEETWNPEAD